MEMRHVYAGTAEGGLIMKIRKNQQEYTDLQGLAYLAESQHCENEDTICANCVLYVVPGSCNKYALSHPEDTLKRLGWEIVEEDVDDDE